MRKARTSTYVSPRSPVSDVGFWRGILLDMDMGVGGWTAWSAVCAAARNWSKVLLALSFVVVWVWTGSLVESVIVWSMWLAFSLTVWVAWRKRRAEGATVTLGDLHLERQQRKQLERQWPLACEVAGLIGPRTKREPPLEQIRLLPGGSLTAKCRAGQVGVSVTRMARESGELADTIGCREVVVTKQGGVATLAFHWRDPIGRPLPLADLPVAPAESLAYGIRQDGSVATVRINQSILIGGLTRHGKSNFVQTLLGDLLRQGIPVELYVSDPKGGVELDAFESALNAAESSLLKVRQYAKTPAETVKMLVDVEKAMHARQYFMKQNGARKIMPSKDNPLVVTILDETLPLTDMLKKGTDSPLGRVAYTGSAASYVIWANTQVAQLDTIGRIRDLFPQRVCFATPAPQVTDSVLGQGAESQGAKCSEIREPGIGFSYAEGSHAPRKFRCALVTDDEVKLIAAGKLPKDVVENTETGYGEASGNTALYRWFHATDDPKTARPQYIGISYDVLKREAEHSQALRAFMAGDVQRTTEWWPSRRSAEEAEKKAIENENPVYNVVHNTKNDRRRLDLRRKPKAKVDA